MKIQENVSLQNMTTMKVGGEARFFVSASKPSEVREAVLWAKEKLLSLFILGGGSNIVIADEGFDGLVIKNCITGVSFEEKGDSVFVTVGAGESWDELVEATVKRGLFGLENLSLIPGTVGAAPVQNIGAYGVEVKDSVVSVQAFNTKNGEFEMFSREACKFSYRDSLFKRHKHYVITSVTLKLQKEGVLNLDYKDIQRKIEENNLDSRELSIADVREMVIAIRTQKLPDWHETPTAGSFFKNPEVTQEKFDELSSAFVGLPGFALANGQIKIPLAWLIENVCHMKGVAEGGAKIYEKHALVVVNTSNATAQDIQKLAGRVASCIFEQTGISIESEVQFVGVFKGGKTC